MRRKALFLLLFLMHAPIFGQQITFNSRRYGTKEGMVSSEVYYGLKDRNGYLWFSSEVGVSKFNGYEFTNFNLLDGLTDNSVFRLYEDYLGRIWYMSFNGGIGFIENDSVNPYAFNDVLLEALGDKGWVNQMVVDSNQTIRFNTEGGGTGEIDRNGIFSEGHNYGGYSNFPLLTENNAGKEPVLVAVLSPDDDLALELYLHRPGQRRQFLTGRLSYIKVVVYPLAKGQACFRFANNLGYIDQDTVIVKRSNEEISTISLDDQKRLWFGTKNNGIAVYHEMMDIFEDKEPVFKIFNGFNVSKVLSEDNGAVWLIVENQGVFYIYNSHVENYDFGTKLRSYITSICEDKKGGLYYATEIGQLVHVDAAGKHELIDDSALDIVQMEMTDSSRLILASFSISKKKKEELEKKNMELVNGRAFCRVNDSTIWLAHTGAIQMVNGERRFATKGFSFYRVIFNDLKGRIWLVGNDGAEYYQNEKLHDATDIVCADCHRLIVKDIKQLADSTYVFVSSDNGLFFVREKAEGWTSHQLTIEGYKLEECYVEEEEKTIWVGSNRGVLRLDFNDKNQVKSQHITFQNGLSSNEVSDILVVGNYVYAATTNGLSKFLKNDIRPNTTPPVIHLKSFLVNGVSKPLEGNLSLNYNENNIYISYEGLSFRTAENTPYRFMLSGVDEDWQLTQSREVRYHNLTAGNYQFFVAAANEDGMWSENQSIRFTIKKPLWKRWWFLLFSSMLILVLTYLFYKERIRRRNRIIQKERETERDKRKIVEARLFALRSQMNPHFTFNALNAIQNVIINFNTKEATVYMTSFSVLIRKILENSEKSAISIDEELEMLKLYTELENLRFNNSIQFIVNMDDSIDSDFEEIPPMIIQPFVENAIIHGLSGKTDGDKRVEITIKLINGGISFTIRDNGIGRVASRKIQEQMGGQHQSFALKIIEERLKLFGNQDSSNSAAFRILDCYDKDNKPTGTQVEIIFKKRNTENG